MTRSSEVIQTAVRKSIESALGERRLSSVVTEALATTRHETEEANGIALDGLQHANYDTPAFVGGSTVGCHVSEPVIM